MKIKTGILVICMIVLFLPSCVTVDPEPTTSAGITVSESAPGPDAPEPQPEPTARMANPKKTPVIWDDDGSPDGVVALMYLLAHPEYEVVALTVSVGEAYPLQFADKLPGMLARLGLEGIPIAAGREDPLQGNNQFPDAWREPTNQFWWLDLPSSNQPVDQRSAAQLMVDIINVSPQPVILFISGSHTNLAEALRFDPGIKKNIGQVAVMGGAIRAEGNLHEGYPDLPNDTAEWNMWIDYLAASEVFSSGLPIALTPLDATDKVSWTRDEVSAWISPGSPESRLAAEMQHWVIDSMSINNSYIWDLVAAVYALEPDLCQSKEYHISVVTEFWP